MSKRWCAAVFLMALNLQGSAWAENPAASQTNTLPVVNQDGSRFGLSGRLAVRDATRASHVVIEWAHQNQRNDIVFLSPLGSTLAVLHSDPAGAVLETADQKAHYGHSLSELATQLLGMALPVDELIAWVQGQVSADANILERYPGGRVRKFAESGWIVEWHRFASDRMDALPELLEVSRGDINVRLRIDQWN